MENLKQVIMKLPPVFLHWRWSWLPCPHLELCWLNILIGIIRAFLQSSSVPSFSDAVPSFAVPPWLGFAKWRRQNLKRTSPRRFLQVKGWGRGERGEGKKKKRKRGRTRKTGRTEMERSKFSDRTNYRNIQEPVSGERIRAVPHSLPCSSSSRSLCPLLFISPPSFFFHFILRSQRGYYWWGTSCTKFSCSVALTTPWELWTSSEALHDSLQPTFGTVSCVCL